MSSGGILLAMALPLSLDPLNPLNPYKGFYGCGGGAAYAPPAPARAAPPSFALPRIITRTVKTAGTEQQQQHHNNNNDADAEVNVGTEPTDAGGKSGRGRGRGGGARGQKSGGGGGRGGGGKSGGRGGRATRRGSRAQGGGGNDDGDDDGDDDRKRKRGRGPMPVEVSSDEESDSDEDEEEQSPLAKKANKGKGRAVTFAADVAGYGGGGDGASNNNNKGGRYFGTFKQPKMTGSNAPPLSRRPGMPPPVPAQDRVAPWGETWAADQMALFDFGETIFAGAYQSAQITADLLRDEKGRSPKVQPPESFPWKTRFELPQPKDMARDADYEKAGVWKLTKENVPELFKHKGATLTSIFPQHSDCNLPKKVTASLV